MYGSHVYIFHLFLCKYYFKHSRNTKLLHMNETYCILLCGISFHHTFHYRLAESQIGVTMIRYVLFQTLLIPFPYQATISWFRNGTCTNLPTNFLNLKIIYFSNFIANDPPLVQCWLAIYIYIRDEFSTPFNTSSILSETQQSFSCSRTRQFKTLNSHTRLRTLSKFSKLYILIS